MAYEVPVIKSVSGNVVTVAHPTLPPNPDTYLAASVSATGTSLSVLDNNGFAINDYIVVGQLGYDKTEIVRITGAVTLGTALTSQALTFDHPVDTQVSKVLWDQVEFSGAATATGVKTVITTTNIQPDRPETTYVVTGATYAFYFVRLKNSNSGVYSEYSDAVPSTGYTDTTVRSVKDSALGMVNEQVSELITERFLNQEIYNCEQEVWVDKKQWGWAKNLNANIGNTTEGGYRVALPSDISDPNSNKAIMEGTVHIYNRDRLTYLTFEEWDRRYRDIVHTTLASPIVIGNATITLTDSNDFDDSGSITIGANSFSYSANDTSTGILTLSAVSTVNVATATDVWQNTTFAEPTAFTVDNGYLYFDTPVSSDYAGKNVYMSYYKKPTPINSDTDALNLPDFTVYHYYLAWKILLKKNNGKSTQETEAMRTMFETRKKNLMLKDNTGQRVHFRPRLNSISYTNRSAQDNIVIRTSP